MNKILTENWNSVVGQEDLVFHLGDFAFGGVKKYLPYLNGEIILIRGNHDRASDLKGCGDELRVFQNYDLNYGGFRFKLNHRPVFKEGTPDPFHDREQRTDIDVKKYDWIICGHVHEKWKVKQKNINVGVDIWDYRPVYIDDLIDFITKI
jgi:calcineurin-like phosphoesterase family protein